MDPNGLPQLRAYKVIFAKNPEEVSYRMGGSFLSFFPSKNKKYMLIRQSKNTFIRTTERYGYITNQMTRHDRTYDENGADWLREISREPQNIDDIIGRLQKNYYDVDTETLKADFMEFAESLARDKFIVMAETIEELDAMDVDFTYAIDNPKTLRDNFYQLTDEKVSENTQDFFLEEVQGRPLIPVFSLNCQVDAMNGAFIAIFPTIRKITVSICLWKKSKVFLMNLRRWVAFTLHYREEKPFCTKI